MANIGNTDTVAARLTPGEVVLNKDQITLLGKITGRNPYELFAAAGVPGSEEQFAGTEGGRVPQGYQVGTMGISGDNDDEHIEVWAEGGDIYKGTGLRREAEKIGYAAENALPIYSRDTGEGMSNIFQYQPVAGYRKSGLGDPVYFEMPEGYDARGGESQAKFLEVLASDFDPRLMDRYKIEKIYFSEDEEKKIKSGGTTYRDEEKGKWESRNAPSYFSTEEFRKKNPLPGTTLEKDLKGREYYKPFRGEYPGLDILEGKGIRNQLMDWLDLRGTKVGDILKSKKEPKDWTPPNIPEGMKGGGVVPDSSHESIDNLIMQNDMNDYSPSLLNMIQGYRHGTVSVSPEDMYAGLGYQNPRHTYIPETLPFDPSAQYGMYTGAAGSFAQEMEGIQPGKGGLRRGKDISDIDRLRREATMGVAGEVGEERQSYMDRLVSSFYTDIREGVITPEQSCEQQGLISCDNGLCVEAEWMCEQEGG